MEIKIESQIDVAHLMRKVQAPAFWKHSANEWWKLITPYVPKVEGTTAETVKVKGDVSEGSIEYISPQAHYLYRGELMVDPNTGSSYAKHGVKKVYTGKELDMSHNSHTPLASKEWDKAAEPFQKPKLIRAMQDYVDGRINFNE